jgi:hypothetical protein
VSSLTSFSLGAFYAIIYEQSGNLLLTHTPSFSQSVNLCLVFLNSFDLLSGLSSIKGPSFITLDRPELPASLMDCESSESPQRFAWQTCATPTEDAESLSIREDAVAKAEAHATKLISCLEDHIDDQSPDSRNVMKSILNSLCMSIYKHRRDTHDMANENSASFDPGRTQGL